MPRLTIAKQPRERDLDSGMVILNVDRAACGLMERSDTKGQAVTAPDLFVNTKHTSKLWDRTIKTILETADCFLFSETMGNGNYERF